MKIREALLDDSAYKKTTIMSVAKYACTSTARFKELIACFLSDEEKLSQRAAWCLGWAAKINTAMITPHIKALVDQLERKDVHYAVIRNSMRVLEGIEIPEALHGDVMNACFGFIETPSTPAAIKAFALTALYNLTKVYPEIKPELKLLIESNMEHESPAFKSRGKKILKLLKKAAS